MQFWPKIRETLISVWQRIVDLNNRPSSKQRATIEGAREQARQARAKSDAKREAIQAIAKSNREREREEAAVIVPEVVKPRRAIRTDYTERSPQSSQLPQVVYVHAPQAPQTTVIVKKSMGCADGCVVVIAILLVFVALAGGCSILGVGLGASALKEAADKQQLEQDEKDREELREQQLNHGQ